MNRLSARTALTASGVGVTVLLAGCGSSGGSAATFGATPASAGQSNMPVTRTHTRTSEQTPSSASASASTTPERTRSTHAGGSTTATAAPPAASPKGHASPGDKPVARCKIGQLKITVGGGNADPQGAHRSLRFDNVSNTVCKLTGAPGVSYVAGDDGHQVGLPAKRIVGHQPIVLIPNAIASAGLFISSAPHKSACAKTTVRGIRVYPPDSYQAAFVPMTEVTCSSAKLGPYLKVGPILPGSNNTV